jgi:hypothetical protein
MTLGPARISARTPTWRRIAVALALSTPLVGCHNNGCGLALLREIELASQTTSGGVDMIARGESRSLKLALQSSDIDSVDLANTQVTAGHVDAFLTETTCDQLFTTPYNGAGTATSPCRVFIGPVAAGSVSAKQSVPQGTYRLFVQAWASNTDAVRFDATVGVYSSDCHLNGTVGPTP